VRAFLFARGHPIFNTTLVYSTSRMTKMETARKERSAFGSLRLRGKIWWLRYRVDGREHEETSRSSSRRVAEKLLGQRQAEFGLGVLASPESRRVGFADLERMVMAHYRNSGLRSMPRAVRALTHLRLSFGAMRAHAVTSDKIVEYETARLAAGAARATVNYELAILRQAFRLAVKARRLSSVPAISLPDPRNARRGFFERDDFDAVLKELPAPLRPVMTLAYWSGWRVPSEILPLRWDRVDFDAGVVRLEPNTTKTDEGRTFPFAAIPELAAVLTSHRDATRALERSAGRVIPFVFHRNGKPIRSFYGAWRAACRRAATKPGCVDTGVAAIIRPHLIGRVPHDLRRTAVRNLTRASVPEAIAMKLTGHRTRAIFDRYSIVREADLYDGVAKLASHLATAATKRSPSGVAKGTEGGQSPFRATGKSA
jgi:integrase